MILSKRTLKRIKNIKEICTFDMKNKTATLTLRFQNINEIIDQRMGSIEDPVICAEAVKALENGLDIVPREFKVNFEITIADYQSYNPQTIQHAYLEAIERRKYKRQIFGKRERSRMGRFFALGLFLLLPVFFSTKYSWFTFFGVKISVLIAFILEIAADLLLEEGLVYFLVTRIADKFSLSNRHRIGIIQLC